MDCPSNAETPNVEHGRQEFVATGSKYAAESARTVCGALAFGNPLSINKIATVF
jgi:hypothetical protein